MNNSWYIIGGRIIDPLNGTDEIADLYVKNGLISDPSRCPDSTPRINAEGLVIAPGFIDIHVHFRQPGNEEAETIESGSTAAAAGGFTTVIVMPNTMPPTDTPDKIKAILKYNAEKALVKLLPAACITKKRLGSELADLSEMAKAGAVAFSDDGNTVANDKLMKQAMEIAGELNIPIMDHALVPIPPEHGAMREGATSRKLGLHGIPSEAETRIVQRDIELAGQTGCAVHIQHVSTSQSVDLIKQAQKQGIRISGEATPHHLMFIDSDITIENTNLKMNPPLGTNEDRKALQTAISSGSIQAFATDHAPHCQPDKEKPFTAAPFGVIGLETAVGATYTCLVKTNIMNCMDWVHRWTIGPALAVGLNPPSLSIGQMANISILDLESEWTVLPNNFTSKSRNTPFAKKQFTGRAIYTIHNGFITWK